MTRLVRLVVLCSVLHALIPVAKAGAAERADSTGATVPPNIQVDRFLQSVIDVLLQKSATFRRQCDTIRAAAHARVLIGVVWMPRLTTDPRARASIGRYSFGALRAVIEMPMIADHAELIPHELEHVIEQIEGLDLAVLAREGGRGVARIGDGSFETDRAKAAGLAAATEVYGATDPAVKGAWRGVGRMWHAVRRPRTN
jgi:hypothetical protein